MINMVLGGVNDNEPSLCFTSPVDYSFHCLFDTFGLIDCSRDSLLAFVKSVADPDDEQHDELTLQQRLQCLLHFEIVLQPLDPDEGLGLQWDACRLGQRAYEQQRLDGLTDMAIDLFRQCDGPVGRMQAEGACEPALAFEDGLIDALQNAFESDLSTARDIVESVGSLELYSREDRPAAVNYGRFSMIKELIDLGGKLTSGMFDPLPPERPAEGAILLDYKSAKLKRKDQPNLG